MKRFLLLISMALTAILASAQGLPADGKASTSPAAESTSYVKNQGLKG